MALPSSPNRSTPSSLRQGDEGWPVFGLQAGLNAVGYRMSADGDFGSETDHGTRQFQQDFHLDVDGIAGERTQGRLIALLDHQAHGRHPRLPVGLVRGFANAEGGNNVGAVNWDVSGGVDCGVMQIRCYGPPFNMSEMKIAYHPRMSMERMAVTFIGRVASYITMPFAKERGLAFAQRCAALSWNWPYAAEQYALRGRLPNPDKDAEWAVIDGGKRVKFPDGAPVNTWQDWAQFYAMGGKHGEGRVTRFVVW